MNGDRGMEGREDEGEVEKGKRDLEEGGREYKEGRRMELGVLVEEVDGEGYVLGSLVYAVLGIC